MKLVLVYQKCQDYHEEREALGGFIIGNYFSSARLCGMFTAQLTLRNFSEQLSSTSIAGNTALGSLSLTTLLLPSKKRRAPL